MINKKRFSLILSIITIFTFTSVSFASSNNIDDFELRLSLYEQKKKNPASAYALSWLFPSIGHAYAGDWGKGLKFFAIELLELGIVHWGFSEEKTYHYNYIHDPYTGYRTRYISHIEYEEENPTLATIALIAFFFTRQWERADAFATAQNYNQQLRHSLKLQPEFTFKPNNIELAVKYNF